MQQLARHVTQAHGLSGLNDLDRVRGAVATALLERMDPHVLARAEPHLKLRSYFHAALIANAMVLRGRVEVERALADEAVLFECDESESERRGLMLLTIFQPDTMVMHARTHRLMAKTLPPRELEAEVLPGFIRLMPLLADALEDPDERIPAIAQRVDGDWTVDGVLALEYHRVHRATTAAI